MPLKCSSSWERCSAWCAKEESLALTKGFLPARVLSMKHVKVLKFGGTSMGSGAAMERVVGIISAPRTSAVVRAVVVSAMSGVTDILIKVATLAARKDATYKKHLDALECRHLDTVDALVSKKNRAHARAEIEKTFRYLNEAATGVALMRDLSPQTLDYVMSYGERLSAHILTEVLNDRGTRAEYLNARKLIVTDGNFGSAHVDFSATNAAIKRYFRTHKKLQ